MFQRCSRDASEMFQTCFRHVSEMFQKRFRNDSGILEGCFGNVLGVLFNVSNLLQGFFGNVFKALSEMSVRRRIKWQWKFGSLSGTVSTFCAFMGAVLGTIFKQRFCGRRCVTHWRETPMSFWQYRTCRSLSTVLVVTRYAPRSIFQHVRISDIVLFLLRVFWSSETHCTVLVLSERLYNIYGNSSTLILMLLN